MTEKKGRGPQRSDRPAAAVAAELKEKRDAFLHTFFKRGAELTDELVHENARLREQIQTLEEDNRALKKQLASDRAIRDLLKKVDELEHQKTHLLEAVHEQEEITGQFSNRFMEVESELESFANLYVASFQLHSSLRARSVVRHIRELLVQLVGARSLAVYFVDDAKRRLEAIASDGVDMATLPEILLQDGGSSSSVTSIVERTYLTGVAHIAEGDVKSEPAACIPLEFEDRIVGAIVVYSLLEQKKRFVTVDRELFKLLGAHAGSTIVAAHIWTAGSGKLPTPQELRAMYAKESQ